MIGSLRLFTFSHILVLFCALLSTNLTLAQDKVSTVNLDSESFSEFDIFADSLDDYSVYFTGENHMFLEFNAQFQFKLLKYLHQEQGVNHFLLEQSPGLTYIMNKVVIDDKTTHMHYLSDVLFDPFHELVSKIHDYNKALPDSSKIQIHGIDIERFPGFSVYALNLMVDTLNANFEGGEVFEQIKALNSSEYKNAGADVFYSNPQTDFAFGFGQVNGYESLQSIINSAEAHHEAIAPVLGADSSLFFSMIESMKVGQEWYLTEQNGDVKSPIIRERYMAREFERVYLQDPDSKFYGQFGRCHLHKDQRAKGCYDYYMNSIANRINELNPSLKNEVLVIPVFYTKSKEFDEDIIESLALEEQYLIGDDTYIIDLAYKKGDHSIVGFYNVLPFLIISNAEKSEKIFYGYDWNTYVEEYHLGASIGYTYFRKLNNLNAVLTSNGIPTFDRQALTYSFYADYFLLGNRATSFGFNYYPEFDNGDRLRMNGFLVTSGSSYPFGNRYLMGAVGLDFGYGIMKMTETQVAGDPNLIQIEGVNETVYRNDIFMIDPNLQFRITLPVISLNAKAGYAFDLSGKYWRLSEKVKDFTKTSFTAPYILVGASINMKN